MNHNQLKNIIFNQHRVNPNALKSVTPYECTETLKSWAKGFCKQGLCFSNVMNMCMVDHADAIIGFVVLDGSYAIEHAWNRDSQGDFDLTFALFLKELTDVSYEYFEMVHLSNKQVQDAYNSNQHIHHGALRLTKDHKDLFNYRMN
jgi:hypothetical protein